MKKKQLTRQEAALVFLCLSALIWFSILLLSCPAFAVDDSVCARVKLEIKQELTLERQAFDAHMRITNGLSHITLEDVDVDVNFSDEEGNSVLASSDPDNPDALFFIRLDSMENIDSVDGSGSVQPSSTADINWLIIPATGASNGLELGTLYYVGATLIYTIGGEEHITHVTPDYIFVKPMPEITLDYFLPADVYGDDAFTPEIEPPVPFSLGVRIKNNGFGLAKDMKISSAQPKIVDNEQGLLIGFAIESCEVNGKVANNSLLADFGDIGPNTAALARWVMSCSLSGQFVEFTADYSHSDELGGELTSLLDAVNTHFLVQDVLVDVAGRDSIRDFLAKDGDVYRIYESEGVDTDVFDQSTSSNFNGSGDAYTLSTPVTSGFMYVKLSDPLGGQKDIKEVVRSDGKRIKIENAWLSKTRNENQEWEYFFNLFDDNATGSYTVAFKDAAGPSHAPVLQFIPDQTVVEGEQLSFLVEATDADGDIPVLAANPLPAMATFTDQGDGTGIFDWTPAQGQAGRYEIIFTASDGTLDDSQRVLLTICPLDDTDLDGMPDSWEMEHFGTLDRDGASDFDEDGISDLDEFLNGTDPRKINHAPSMPVINAPEHGAEITQIQPDLVIQNSVDEDGDTITYEFELYSDEEITILVASKSDVFEGTDTTSWSVSTDLNDNTRYFWRVRATDGDAYSLWAYGSFFVNMENDPPGGFNNSSPRDNIEVDTQTPTLQVTNSVDIDEDPVTYTFEVYADRSMSALITSASGISEGENGTASWLVNTMLDDDTMYFWRVVATDEHGALSETPLVSFLVNTLNAAPGSPLISSPVAGSETPLQELDLVVTNAADAVSYFFELDRVNTFDSPAMETSGEIAEEVDTTSWQVTGLEDNTRYYWRVKAGDAAAESNWIVGDFFVNTANDAPSSPTVKNPGEKAWVETLTPSLLINSAGDPDNDSLIYRFELYSDDSLTNLVAQGESSTTELVVSSELENNTRYYWRAQAEDEHGMAGDWMNIAYFFVSADNAPPPNIEVQVETDKGRKLSGLRVYAFTESGSYTGKNATTDENGTALFVTEDFEDGGYKFRVDYLGQRFWSDPVSVPGVSTVDVVVAEETAEVTVTTAGGHAQGVRVYLFSETGSYLGIYEVTDENGLVSFDLPAGSNFKFRADILGNRYWSETTTISGGGTNSVPVDAGGGLFRVTVQEDPQDPIEGIRVYLFSETGSYLGRYEVTGSSGQVAFDVSEGTYKARADYLGYKFWTGNTQVTTDTNIDLTIAHQDISITVNGMFQEAPDPVEGIKVYLFSSYGSYLGQYQVTDDSGQVCFHLPQNAYKVRCDFLGGQFWSDDFNWLNTPVNIPMADAQVTVTGAGLPQEGVKVYLFSASGSYLGIYETTGSDGKVLFRIPESVYKFRADYQGSQFWSGEETLTTDQVNPVNISTGGGSFIVTVQTDAAGPVAGVNCYVFNEADVYLGMFGATDADGQVSFDLSNGAYKFLVDCLGHQFWSETAIIPDISATQVTIEKETVEVTVTTAGGPAGDIRVYLFSESGSYLGIYEVTDENGQVSFDLPVGSNFKFRADILGSQYWSEITTISGGGTNSVPVDTVGGLFQVTVEKVSDNPMEGIKVYLFSETGSYLNRYEVTDSSGEVTFDVSEGIYKVRADYLGYQFWTDEITVTQDTDIDVVIPHQQVEISVQGVFQTASDPMEMVKVYLFTPTGSYLNQYQITDSAGKVVFELPQKDYRVRADLPGAQFWADVFEWQNTAVNIPMADADVTVTGAGLPREGIKVYLFSSSGSYLGIYETTGSDGKVAFRIPAGVYKFRAAYQGSQFWSGEETLTADQVNPVIISTGGGAFTFTTLKSETDPLVGVKCYVFSEGGSYLGMSGVSGSNGTAGFDLSDGTYKFRIDYLGCQFWSGVYSVPSTLSGTLTLTHQDVVITVESLYQESDPITGVKVYLFNLSGSYLGQYRVTDDSGQVLFNLPDREYKVRTDYLGGRFWSEVFQSQDTVVTISQGLADVHVRRSGNDVAGAKVYLFSEAGSYLGSYKTTDASGRAEFVLPDRAYKFRADEGGAQSWSEVINITAGQANSVELDFD